MLKKINYLIFIFIIVLLTLTSLSKYKELSADKELWNTLISEIEKNVLVEYKSILKNSINSTIIMIDATYNTLVKNKTNLMKSELIIVLNQISNYNQNELTSFINTYTNEFYSLNLKKTNNIINEKIKIKGLEFYLSFKNKKLNNIFENEVRSFLYKNITKDNRYIWVNEVLDFNGGNKYARRLIHPNLKNTEGRYLSTFTKDIEGKKPYLVELSGIKKKKELFFRYSFKVISTNQISEKLTYAKLYEKKNWIIATGIPLTDLNKNIAKRKKEITEVFEKHLYLSIAIEVFIFILFIFVLLSIRSKLIKYFEQTKKLEEELSKKLSSTEEQFSSFFNLSINLQIITDFKGVIIQISNSSKYILGFTREELINTSFLNLVHEEDTENTLNQIKKLEDGNAIYYFENRIKHKKGHYITLAWSANENAEKTLIYASAHDKTKLKEKETLLFHQSKMASMGEMIESIAHQWKQPLSILSTISTSIKFKNEIDILEKDEIEESMNSINNSVQHLSSTIDDFRTFFKTNKRLTSFKISDALEKTFTLTFSEFKSADILIIKEIEEVTLCTLENELTQVFINIINNAKDELVKIHNKRILLIKIEKIEDSVLIKITDNAGGIPTDIHSKIFESHFTTKENEDGTGIGLYMSKIIIEEHMNGKLYAKNETFTYEGDTYTGASFIIEIPLDLDLKGK